ncbi:MAG: L,D-transpeptidase family protein [Vulcanimicrobiota bacterium]
MNRRDLLKIAITSPAWLAISALQAEAIDREPYLYVFRHNAAKGGGKLSYWSSEPSGSVIPPPLISSTFWENPDNLIPAKRYTGCSVTTMTTKGYRAIYLPDEQTGKTGIFIHQGSSPSHSDGCIVCSKSVIDFIFERTDKNAKNIIVDVIDKQPQPVDDW